MSQPTTAVFFSASDPAPPPGLQNTVPQSDGAQPVQKISSFMPLAIPGADGAAGAVKPDGTSITQDEDGTIHAAATSTSTSGGTATSASGGQMVCVHPTPDPTDGTRTQFILPAPVLAGTDYWLNRNDTIQRQLGPKAYYAVQGTQLTLVSPLESDGYLEFHYIQGTPNSESGGGGSVNPANPSYVQSASATAGSSGALSCAYSQDVAAGDVLIAVAGCYGSIGSFSSATVTDTQGNTWSKVTEEHYGSSNVVLWKAVASVSGPNTVTSNLGAGGANDLAVLEYRGSSVVDTTASNSGTGGTITVPVLTASGDQDVLVVALYDQSHQSTWSSSPSDLAPRQTTVNPNNEALAVFDGLITVAGSCGGETLSSSFSSFGLTLICVALKN